STNSFRARLPDTARSPHRVPEFTARRVNGHEIRSPENAGQPSYGTHGPIVATLSTPTDTQRRVFDLLAAPIPLTLT
ncbi:hypothetical protein, partial [Mycobacterium sp.]|uniref:hypothetical protein n=1 Tax=Mycobacterium sp. TaxID=1785 RepID=UPI003F9B481E